MKLSIKIPFIVLFIMFVIGCTPSSTIKPDNSLLLNAQAANAAGNYASAADLFLQLAQKSKASQQAQFYLNAAEAFWSAKNAESAVNALNKVNSAQLMAGQQIDAKLLLAEIELFRNNPEQALTALTSFSLANTTNAQSLSALTLRIQAYQLTENWLEKANSHIKIAEFLPTSELLNNQQLLWQSLMKLTPQALDLFNPSFPPAVNSGWFALAYLVKSYPDNPEVLMVAFDDWKRSYPNHPADPSLYKDSLLSGTRLPKELNSIAVLLPRSGPYEQAANAIRQGIIAAHYAENSTTQLHFLDIENDKTTGITNVWQRYQEAITLGADLVLGPLDKESIDILVSAETLPIPVLALNRVNEQVEQNVFFQFGLAPEDDAIAAARYASQQNFKRALVLSPNNAWGKRVSSAFVSQWQKEKGQVLKQSYYSETDHDFSSLITPFFDIDASEQRNRSLKQTLGKSTEFEPRRRQDVDFIFLVARSSKARQLVPQLKFFRSGRLAIITTSHAYSGYENTRQDIDLENVILNDIPWVFEQTASNDPVYLSLKNNNDPNFSHLIRLYAFGSDAYHLITQLNTMSRDPFINFNGATGQLSIDEHGVIQRKMQPASFKQGKIKALTVPSNTEQ
jgi:outer membrane PBP1 activator LpoA protein